MRYLHSVVRFVPDPARGEFVNIGAIVGSEETAEWELRIVVNPKRAKAIDDQGVLPQVWRYLSELDSEIEAFAEPGASLFDQDQTSLSEAWLERLWQESNNLIQFSRPAPIVANTLREALAIVFSEYVLEPVSRRFPFQKKTSVLAALRRQYEDHGLSLDRDYLRRVLVQGEHHKEQFDFAVWNSHVLQLAQAWSFQIPQKEQLLEDIKAWSWTVRDIRHYGGRVELPGRDPVAVPGTVDVEVVYVPPAEDDATPILEEALSAFDEIKVRAVRHELSDQVAQRARDLLQRP
jgi:hypothetical protein